MATRNTTNGKKMTHSGRLGGASNPPQRPGGLGKTPGRTPSGVPVMGGKAPSGVVSPKGPTTARPGRTPTTVPTTTGKLPTGTAVKTPKGNGPSGIWITRGKKK